MTKPRKQTMQKRVIKSAKMAPKRAAQVVHKLSKQKVRFV